MNRSHCREVLECASPLTLWTGRYSLAKLWRTTAVQDAGAWASAFYHSRFPCAFQAERQIFL